MNALSKLHTQHIMIIVQCQRMLDICHALEKCWLVWCSLWNYPSFIQNSISWMLDVILFTKCIYNNRWDNNRVIVLMNELWPPPLVVEWTQVLLCLYVAILATMAIVITEHWFSLLTMNNFIVCYFFIVGAILMQKMTAMTAIFEVPLEIEHYIISISF